MTGSLLIPLDIPGGHPGPHSDGGMSFFPFLGVPVFFLLLLVTAGVLFYLSRTGRLGPPPWAVAGHRAPEAEAKKILADRFANGDISAEEFMERASVLNWTPGVEPISSRPAKKKRR